MLSARWICVHACAHVVSVAPWIVGAWLALHPLPACNEHCRWVIPPQEFGPGGLFYAGRAVDGRAVLPEYAAPDTGFERGAFANSGFERRGFEHSDGIASPLPRGVAEVPQTSPPATAVPEPGSTAVLAAALVALAWVLWRKPGFGRPEKARRASARSDAKPSQTGARDLRAGRVS